MAEQHPTPAGDSVPSAQLTAKATRHEIRAVVMAPNSAKLVVQGSVLERGPHVPVTYMGYFKPPSVAFLTELRAKDLRSAKEWEHINAAGASVEMGWTSLSQVAKHSEGDVQQIGRLLSFAEEQFKASLDIILMRAQYFPDITEQGADIARQMSFLFEQGQDAVFSESHRTAREALSSKMEVKAVKHLAKARLAQAGKKGNGGNSDAAQSD